MFNKVNINLHVVVKSMSCQLPELQSTGQTSIKKTSAPQCIVPTPLRPYLLNRHKPLSIGDGLKADTKSYIPLETAAIFFF